MANYIKCSAEVHRLLKVRAAQTGAEMQEIAEQALTAWLSAGTSTPGSKVDVRGKVMELPVSKLHARWYSDLSEILMNGNPDEQATLKRLIEFLVKQIRERSAATGGSTADDGPPQGGHPATGGGRRKQKAD